MSYQENNPKFTQPGIRYESPTLDESKLEVMGTIKTLNFLRRFNESMGKVHPDSEAVLKNRQLITDELEKNRKLL